MPERAKALAVLAIAVTVLSPAASAREVRATFLSLGADGERQQSTLSDVRYGYFVRDLLAVRPRRADPGEAGPATQAVPHRDRTLRKRALILQNAKIPLHMIRSIDFSHREADTAGAYELVLRVTLVTGTERDVPASELRGFESFSPPFLEGVEGQTVVRYALTPFRRGSEEPRQGDLERVVFHTQRRAPPERKK
jgi:hypothetical protein